MPTRHYQKKQTARHCIGATSDPKQLALQNYRIGSNSARLHVIPVIILMIIVFDLKTPKLQRWGNAR